MPFDYSAASQSQQRPLVRDWLSLGVFALCIVGWAAGLAVSAQWPVLGFIIVVFTLVLHSSLSHEVLHGGIVYGDRAGTLLGIIQPGVAIPYLRFKRTHLAHHHDPDLTDPYDDPESNYMDPAVWAQLPAWHRRLLRMNNTLLGRMLLGPVLGQWSFMRSDARAIAAGDRQIASDWAWHLLGLVPVIVVVTLSSMSWLIYGLAIYAALAILKVRTFAEHCAHARASARTAIVEDRGVLAFLFLNNNLHVVHHMHPTVPWYRLPALYGANKDRYRARNDNYVFANYLSLARNYLLKTKDPVPHPLWQDKTSGS